MSSCPTCGDDFDSQRAMRIHHSKLHDESISGFEKTCPVCNDKFVARNKNNVYCGKDCQHKSLVVDKTKVCEECGGEFSGNSGRKYCSIECVANSQRQSVELICQYCKETYIVPQYRKNSSTYCSNKCKGANKADYTTIECGECGDKFEIPSWHIETYGTEYCSTECASDSRRNGVELVCYECEDIFYVPKHRSDTAKFCDKYCKKKYETANYDRGRNSGSWSTFSKKYRNWVGECESCGSVEQLHTHHDEPIFKGGDVWDNTFTVLCQECHIGNYSEWH